MKKSSKIFAIVVLVSVITGCANSLHPASLPLNKSAQYYEFIQPTFSQYLESTEEWLAENRSFISSEHDKEIAMNMPFELSPSIPTDKAIILVHGLGDSPYSFSDLGPSLARQGFHVQTLLLPGHGSKPEDLTLPSYSDWQLIVDHYANLLKREYKEVWLGGFSTGANLVTIHALETGGIDGLLLFSPGFVSRAPILEKFAPLAALFYDGYTAEEKNIARYTSAPLNGAIAYTKSASRLRELLNKPVPIRTLIAVSESDSVVDSVATQKLYEKYFTNPHNHLLWYGEKTFAAQAIESMTMRLDKMRVSTGSHMSPLFSPSNPYYGQLGERRMCMNSFDEDAKNQCEAGEEVWFSAWGYQEKGKIHARLTWNPYYKELEQSIHQLVNHQF